MWKVPGTRIYLDDRKKQTKGRYNMRLNRMLLGCAMILWVGAALPLAAQTPYYVVDFEGVGETKGSYATGSVTLSGVSWTLTEAVIGTLANDFKNGARSGRLRGYGVSEMFTDDPLTNGIGAIAFFYRRYGTDAQVSWQVEYSTNETDWVQIGDDFTAPTSDDVQTFAENVGVEGDVWLRIRRAEPDVSTTDRRLNVDDISIYAFGDSLPSGTLPIISLDPAGAEKDVRENEILSFDVIASQDPGDAGQETELAALELPVGATFMGATGAAPVSASFDWTPDTMGVYTAIFTAADTEGVVTQEVVITVEEGYPLGTVIVDFEGAGETKGGYASGTVNLSGYDWDLTEALIGISASDFKNGVRAGRMRGYGASAMTMLEDLTNGLGEIEFLYSRYGTDSQVSWIVQYSVTAGSSWTQIGDPFTADATVQTFSETVDIGGDVRVRIIREVVDASTADRRLNVDDIVLIPSEAAPPGDLPPVISLVPDDDTPIVFAGNPISFDVIASQVPADDGQDTELTATELPAGSTFDDITDPAPVQSTFDWTPLVAGVYTASFSATDIDGTTLKDVVITVLPAPDNALAYYTFNYQGVSPDVVAADLVAGDLGASAGSVGSGTTAGGWDGSGVPYAELSGGWSVTNRDDAKYYTFTLTADPGWVFSITNISLYQRATGAGPSAMGINLDGTDDVYFEELADSVTVHTSVPIAGYTGLSTVEIRIQGWDNGSRTTSGTGAFRVDDILVQGVVEADGEPPEEGPEVTVFVVAPGGSASATVPDSTIGREYHLMYTTNLVASPVVWITVDSVSGTGGEIVLEDIDPSDTIRIYRVLEEDEP